MKGTAKTIPVKVFRLQSEGFELREYKIKSIGYEEKLQVLNEYDRTTPVHRGETDHPICHAKPFVPQGDIRVETSAELY
jgi:hypothetical protein